VIGRYGFRSLRFKLVLASTLVEALLLTLLVANSVRLMNQSLIEQTEIRLEELAPLLNASLAPPLAQRDYAALQDILDGIVQAKGLVYIQVLDYRHHLVARAGAAPERIVRDADLGAAGGDEVFDQEQPLTLGGQALGRVQFGLSTAPMQAAKAAILNQGVGIALAEVAATFALLAVLGFLLTRNLLRLAAAAQRAEAGDLGATVNVPARDEIGETARAFNHMLAALRQTIAALRQSEENFRALAENARDGIAIGAGEDGRLVFANRSLAEMLGYGRAEELLDGHRAADLIAPAERARVLARYRSRLKGEEAPAQDESLMLRRDGALVPAEFSAARTVWQGEPAGLAIVRDVSERKRAEAERERLLAELTAKNAEMENFLYTISHDLKSPLITIGGFAGVLEKDLERRDPVAMRADLDEIRRATAHMQRLIDDLLALARIGRVVGEPEPTDLGTLLEGVRQRLREQIAESAVVIEVAPDLPRLRVDPRRFAQVFENLLDNAIKFRRADEPLRVEIGWQRAGPELRIGVRDNGRGIEPAYHERVFALFERTDPDTEGTGVGLAIARRIVEVHGGRLWVESAPGRGSVFWIALPQSVIVKTH
jgi:PAS domain S-box-containing protein